MNTLSRSHSLSLQPRRQRYHRSLLLFVTMALTTLSPLASAFLFPLQTTFKSRTASTTTTAPTVPNVNRQHNNNDNQLLRLYATAQMPATVPMSLTDFELYTPEADVLDLKEGQRLVCLGDVHGDVQALRTMLHVAGLVNEHDLEGNSPDGSTMRWTGGNAILVQTGDILDRGDAELACWRLLAGLSQQAANAGGAVIILWGNHEAL